MKSLIRTLWLVVALAALTSAVHTASAQARYRPRYIEPKWFTFRLAEVSAGIYAQGHWQQTSYRDSDISVDYYRWFTGPSIGLQGGGSIYHPNLVTYNVDTEGAFGYATDHYSGNGVDRITTEEWEYLGRASVTLDFLATKPYRGGLFANYDHTYRENDFFSTLEVDSWRYGARATWEHGPWLWNFYYSHREEDSSSPYPVLRTISVTNVVDGTNMVVLRTNNIQNSLLVRTLDDTVSTGLKHRRERGETDLTYNFNRYYRDDFGRLGQGDDHSIALSDSERFGSREQHHWSGNLSYAMRDSDFDSSEEFLAYTSFSAEHRPDLSSFYDFNYNNFNLGSFESDSFGGQAQLTHQLYESLATSLIVRGSSFESTDNAGEGYNRRLGAGLSNTYTKRTSEQTRLRISHSIFVDHVEEEGLGIVINERHSVMAGGESGAPPNSFFLNQPFVTRASIIITDDRNTLPPYLEGFDYQVVTLGSRTLIEWLRPPGPGTPTVVLVDYESEPRREGQYEVLTDTAEVRFEMWKNLVGIYARVGLSDNNARADMMVQEFITYAVGADMNYRNLTLGAEYQIYDGSDSDYDIFRLWQAYSWRFDEGSTLSLNFDEMWINYETLDRQEQDYRAMVRYHKSLSTRWSLSTDAGVAYRTGTDIEQLLATFRPAVRYKAGKMSLDAGYDFQYELFLNREERLRNMLFVRLKRVF